MLKCIEHSTGDKTILTVDEMGEANGPFEIHYKEGCIGKGTKKNGETEGWFEIYDKKGILKSRRFFKYGKWDGPVETYRNGQLEERRVFCRLGELHGDRAEAYLLKWRAEQEELAKKEQTKALVRQKKLVQKKEQQEKTQRQQDKKKNFKNLKEKLAEISDLEKVKETITPARTPERTDILARIMRVRKAKSLLSKAAQKAHKEGDKQTLQEIVEIAKPFAAREAVVRDKFSQRQAARRTQKNRG